MHYRIREAADRKNNIKVCVPDLRRHIDIQALFTRNDDLIQDYFGHWTIGHAFENKDGFTFTPKGAGENLGLPKFTASTPVRLRDELMAKMSEIAENRPEIRGPKLWY